MERPKEKIGQPPTREGEIRRDLPLIWERLKGVTDEPSARSFYETTSSLWMKILQAAIYRGVINPEDRRVRQLTPTMLVDDLEMTDIFRADYPIVKVVSGKDDSLDYLLEQKVRVGILDKFTFSVEAKMRAAGLKRLRAERISNLSLNGTKPGKLVRRAEIEFLGSSLLITFQEGSRQLQIREFAFN